MRIAWAVLASVMLAACSPQRVHGPEENAAAPRITAFYASPSNIPSGESGELCYGVENATEVKLDPPAGEVWPALTRCIPIQPRGATTYVLTAGNASGNVTKTVHVGTAAARAKFLDVSVNADSVKPGGTVAFCYKAANAVNATGGPGKFVAQGSANKGCVMDNPRQTTTYRLTIRGESGDTEQREITVKVR